MSKYDNQFRLGTAAALAVKSVGGAAASSGAFSIGIFNVQLASPRHSQYRQRLQC
jgi:hypothetical protein